MSKLKIYCILVFAIGVTLNQSRAFGSQFYKTSFSSLYMRYGSVYSLFSDLERLIPFRKTEAILLDCKMLTESNVAILGSNEPSQMAPSEGQPGSGYLLLAKKCIENTIHSSFADEKISSQNASAILRDVSKKIPRMSWVNLKINQIDQSLQLEITKQMILFVVGSEDVLKAYGYFGEKNIYENENIKNFEDLVRYVNSQILINSNKSINLAEYYFKLILKINFGPLQTT